MAADGPGIVVATAEPVFQTGRQCPLKSHFADAAETDTQVIQFSPGIRTQWTRMELHSGSEGSHGARGSQVSIGVNAYAAYRTSGLGLRIVGQRSGTPGAVSLRRRRLGDMCGINQQSTYGPSGCTLLDWKKSKGAEGYVPPRSNGLIAGRSLMIAHNLESVSGSRLLWPAMVIK